MLAPALKKVVMGAMMKLVGRVAVVTGAAQGIGKAIALKLAEEGASVVVGDVQIEKASLVAEEIRRAGGQALPVAVDVSSRSDVQNMVDATLRAFDSVHILINNAGIMRSAPLLEFGQEAWDAVMSVNLRGAFNCSQAVLEHMMAQRYGKIVSISSVTALGHGVPNALAYAASKAGVVQLTKVLARAAGPFGINVNSVAPGSIPTAMTAFGLTEEQLQSKINEKKEQAVLGRTGEPKDIANAVLFLVSDDASFITGQVLKVDGGRTDAI